MVLRPTRAALAAVLAICGMAAFAADGLRAYFTPDDMMNLYGAWSSPAAQLLQEPRPLGALVYRGIFALFGLNPLPFRIACAVLLMVNLGLLYLFCLRLTRSAEVAVLGCLLGAYHAHLADLYYSTGTLYDLLVYFFIVVSLIWYFRFREAGYPDWRQTAVLTGLYLCALASKESAVTVPALVLIYEWIYRARRPYSWTALRGWLAGGARFLYLAIPITAAYVAVRTVGPHAMTGNPDYIPRISLHAFFAGWRHYLFSLLYGAVAFNSFKTILLFALLLAFALLARRRELLFAWCVILVGALPVIFIPPRGFFVMYTTLPGWYLYAASALVLLRDWLVRQFPRWAEQFAVRPGQLALFVAVAALLIPLHLREKPAGSTWVPEAHTQVRQILEELQRRNDPLPRGARVLFLSDPYPVNEWLMTFVFRLYYRDATLQVDRVKPWPQLGQPEAQARYDRVYVLDAGGLKEVGRKQ